LNTEYIRQTGEKGYLTGKKCDQLLDFIGSGDQGLVLECDSRIGGYVWQQFCGDYSFGDGGKMAVPPNFVVIKNLYVFRQFRGRGFAKRLNTATLGVVAAGIIPIVFVMTENRYAIRSYESLGFREMIMVSRKVLFGRFCRTKIKKLSSHPIAEQLASRIS